MPTSRYQVLLQERAELVAEGESLFAAAEAATRGLTAEEQSRDDAIQARIEEIAGDLEREERRRERQRAVGSDGADLAALAAAQRGRITSVHDRRADEPWGTRTGSAFGEFLQAVARVSLEPSAERDARLVYQAALGGFESGGADGGFLVQADVAQGIIRRMYEMGQILSRVRHIPISSGSNALELNAINETSRATGSRLGGVQGYWTEEGGSVTATRPKFKKIALKLKKLAALGYATDELLGDAAALESIMTEAFAEELTFLAEDAIFEGTGAGQPLGILKAPALISVAKETGQAPATLLKENVDKMYARMWAPSRQNAVWLINQDVEPQLEALSAVVGVGGIPVFLPPGGYTEQPNARLKGRPVLTVEYPATLGTVGDIVFADLSQYVVIEKGGVQQAQSMHVAFVTDEMAFRTIYRIDGQPSWHQALTPFKGSNTLSPFVALATRA